MVLTFIGGLILIMTGCAGPQGAVGATGVQGPQGPAGPPASASIVAPSQVPANTTAITVYVSGFVPQKNVVIKLIGKWKVAPIEVVDPILDGGIVNANGAAKFNSSNNFITAVNTYKLAPGVYTLAAEQGDLLVTTPIEIIEVKK